jgi:hypothetical protein
MNKMLGYFGAVVGVLICGNFCAGGTSATAEPTEIRDKQLARQIIADSTLNDVDRMAHELLRTGFNAGTGYSGTWIRDLNTFIQVSLQANPQKRIRDALLMFFKFQGDDGDIIDGFVQHDPAQPINADDRTSPLAPGYIAFKNSVETDQESSLVQAIFKYISVTHDQSILDERIGNATVAQRLERALEYVHTQRFDPEHGLVWGATTLDWGDVQPESPQGVRLDDHSHRALSIYDNAMFLIAIHDYVAMPGGKCPHIDRWKMIGQAIHNSTRKYLWDAKDEKFIPHVYLAGSPFPRDFDENAIYYHGGTAIAIEAGLLDRHEVLEALHHMEMDVKLAHASSIGLTMYPPYPRGFFKNPQVSNPYSYQNGGDWCWFGGRMIQQLIRYGYVADAYRDLRPMVERVKRTGGFYEWWSRDNQPRGSGDYRGSAGVLGEAIEMLDQWARKQITDSQNK